MINTIRPTTLAGIKSLARDFKTAEGIQYAKALDKASNAAGHPNFRAAHNALVCSTTAADIPSFPLFITEYWKDRDDGRAGRETFELRLARPWHELIDPRKLATHRATSGFFIAAPDHLEMRGRTDSQSQARRSICAAARLFHFVQSTGLRPATGVRSYIRAFTDRNLIHEIPGRDHASLWFDPELERYLYAIEPYVGPDFIHELTRWAMLRGIEVADAGWGIYSPDNNARLLLLSQKDHGIPLAPVLRAIAQLPKPLVEADWNGMSAPMRPFFTSPRHGEPSLLNAKRRERTEPVRPRGRRQMHWGRKLLVLGVNELLQRQLIGRNPVMEENGHCEALIAGRTSIIQWHDIGHEELRISVWWDYDHSRHPQANLTGSCREEFKGAAPLAKRSSYRHFVAATASGWLERKTGLALQGRGRRGLIDLYQRTDAKTALRNLPTPDTSGFKIEGPVF